MINLRMLSSFFVLLSLATATSSTITVSNQGGEDFTTIQAAIDAARPGDTIEVLPGTYHENVVVNKTLIMRGIGLPEVDALGNGSAITLKADGTILDGFIETNSSGYVYTGMPDRFGGAGIVIYSNHNTVQDNFAINNSGCGIAINWASSNNTLINNNISNNLKQGIFLYGSYNNLTRNIVSNNWVGINIDESQNNVLEGNIVSNNSRGGITLAISDNNILHRNQIFGNKENIVDIGRNNSVDASNLIEGIPIT